MKTLGDLLDECRAEAERENNGHIFEWEPTAEDLEWVCGELGHMPSREEWAAAGWPNVGDAHCGVGRGAR